MFTQQAPVAHERPDKGLPESDLVCRFPIESLTMSKTRHANGQALLGAHHATDRTVRKAGLVSGLKRPVAS
jgi:hypothetical protein